MADVAFWVDRLLEFLRLRGPAQGMPPEPARSEQPQPRMRSHGLRAARGAPVKPKKDTTP